jgi:hypothetical protein
MKQSPSPQQYSPVPLRRPPRDIHESCEASGTDHASARAITAERQRCMGLESRKVDGVVWGPLLQQTMELRRGDRTLARSFHRELDHARGVGKMLPATCGDRYSGYAVDGRDTCGADICRSLERRSLVFHLHNRTGLYDRSRHQFGRLREADPLILPTDSHRRRSGHKRHHSLLVPCRRPG